MATHTRNSGSIEIACLRYRDAARAIDWLCAVFGFTCRDPEGHIWRIGSYDPLQEAG